MFCVVRSSLFITANWDASGYESLEDREHFYFLPYFCLVCILKFEQKLNKSLETYVLFCNFNKHENFLEQNCMR